MDDNKDLQALLSDPKKALLHMALPLLLTYLVARLQTFIDSVWCAGLGPDPLSAIAIAGPMYRIIISVGLAIGVGASAAIARNLGASNRDGADRSASHSIIVALILSMALMPVFYLAAPFVISLSGGGYNVGLTMDYVMPFIICTLPLTVNGLLTGLFRGEGAARKSTVISVSASLTNMVLDPIMIYGLDMGVVGASWATCISFITATAAGWIWYRNGSSYVTPAFRGFGFDVPILKDLGILSIPLALESVLASLLIAPEQGLVASCGGSDGLVVYINSFSFIDLVLIPATAIAAALIPVVSAQMGQRQPEKVVSTFRYSAKIITILGVASGLLLFVSADLLIGIYTYSEGMSPLHDEMVLALRIYCVVPLLNGLMRLGTSMIQAMRRAVFSTIVMFSRELLFLAFFWFASQISMTAIYWSVDLTNLIMMPAILIIAYMVLRNYLRSESIRTA